MRKWIITLVVLAILGAGGYIAYGYAHRYVADRVMDQVITQVMEDDGVRQLLEDPEIVRLLEEAASSEDIEALHRELGGQLGGTAGTGGGQDDGTGTSVPRPELVVRNVEEAEALVLDKFSIGAIREYAGMASGGLTAEELAVLEQEVMGKFTPEELESLKLVALMEMQKRQ